MNEAASFTPPSPPLLGLPRSCSFSLPCSRNSCRSSTSSYTSSTALTLKHHLHLLFPLNTPSLTTSLPPSSSSLLLIFLHPPPPAPPSPPVTITPRSLFSLATETNNGPSGEECAFVLCLLRPWILHVLSWLTQLFFARLQSPRCGEGT